MEWNLVLKFEVTDEDIEDIMVSMLEGGCGYWACLDNTTADFENAPEDEPVAITAANILGNGGDLHFIDEEDGNAEYDMTLEDLLNGIGKWISRGYAKDCVYYDNGKIKIDTCNFDGIAGDMVAQLAMFGEVIYG